MMGSALTPTSSTSSRYPNPGPLKAALAAKGLMQDELRSPMTRVPAARRQRLLDTLQALSRP